jgi:hypothetical protein
METPGVVNIGLTSRIMFNVSVEMQSAQNTTVNSNKQYVSVETPAVVIN